MKVGKRKIHQLFSKNYQFLVPLFQRKYVWDKENWSQLWDDISKYYLKLEKEGFDNPESLPYNYGTCYLQHEAVNSPKWVVIDGQQRLITMAVILSVIRDLFPETTPEITKRVVISRETQGTWDERSRIIPSEWDKEHYYQIIGKKDAEKSRLLDAYIYFRKKLKDIKRDDLHQLLKILLGKIELVLIALDPSEDPYSTYEAVNGRGKQLAESDLVRNQFFRVFTSPEEAKGYYAQYWKPMEELFKEGQIDFSFFLRLYYMRDGRKIGVREIFSTMRDDIEDLSETEIKNKVKELYLFAQYYLALKKPQNSPLIKNAELVARLSRIHLMGTDSPYPLLMNCLYQNNHSSDGSVLLSDDEFIKITQVIETYLVTRAICGKTTSQLPSAFAKICKIHKGDVPFTAKAIIDSFSELKGGITPVSCDEFEENLLSGEVYHIGGGNSGLRVLLLAIEEQLRKDYEKNYRVHVDWPDLYSIEDIQLEHVMPQELTDIWKEELGSENEDIHESLLHTLGNLTLTRNNQKISNSSFAEKRNIYEKELLIILNQTICENNSWGKDEISARTKMLMDAAKTIYCSSSEVPPTSECNLTGDLSGNPESITVLGNTVQVTKWYEISQVTIRRLIEEFGETFFIDVKSGKFDILITEKMTQTRCNDLKRRINPIDLKIDFTIGELRFKTKESSRFIVRDLCMMLILAAGLDWNEENWCLKLDFQ